MRYLSVQQDNELSNRSLSGFYKESICWSSSWHLSLQSSVILDEVGKRERDKNISVLGWYHIYTCTHSIAYR